MSKKDMSRQMQLSQIELEEPVLPGISGNSQITPVDVIVIIMIIAVF